MLFKFEQPPSKMARTFALIWVYLVVLFIALMIGHPPAWPHDVSKAKTATEAAVFNFYASWYRPPERTMSCCNMEDCRVVEIRRKGDVYFFLDNKYWHSWRHIPPDRLEHNARDPRESPDGSSHVCFNSMYVLCAVLGSGQ